MFRSISLTTFLCLFLLRANAQSLYMPRDIQNAFKKETRSLDGKPGKNYWQNHGKRITLFQSNDGAQTAPLRGVEQINLL